MGELKQHQPPMTIDEQEEKYNDKSIIHLPRQYTGNSLKSAYFQGIFGVGFVVLHRFYTV